MPPRLADRGLVYDARDRPPAEQVASFTSLCPLGGGSWICAFQLGSGKHAPDAAIRLCGSTDGGRSWTELEARFPTCLAGVPGSLAAPELVELRPGRLRLFATWFDRSDPQRPLFDPATEGILRSKQLWCESGDGGRTFGSWNVLPTGGLTGCATTGPLVAFPDGRIAYALESFKEFDDPRPARHGAWVVLVEGDGSFSEPLLVAQDPQQEIYYWDQRLAPTAGEGEFLALFWTHDRRRKCDRCVHLRRASIGPRGIEGPPVRATDVPGQIAAPLVLADGRTLAFVVDRRGPATLKLWTSPDGGATWPREECLTVYTHDERALLSQGSQNIDFNAYWEDMGKWSFGHPAIRALGDREALLAYYAGPPGQLSVHWARVEL